MFGEPSARELARSLVPDCKDVFQFVGALRVPTALLLKGAHDGVRIPFSASRWHEVPRFPLSPLCG